MFWKFNQIFGWNDLFLKLTNIFISYLRYFGLLRFTWPKLWPVVNSRVHFEKWKARKSSSVPKSCDLKSLGDEIEQPKTPTNSKRTSKSDRNCLALKDESPTEWKKAIEIFPTIRHLTLSTVWFVSSETFSYELEPIPIADTLNVGKKLSSLESLVLQEISQPLDFDNLFTFRNHMNKLATLEMSNLKIHFTNIDSLAGFSLSLNAHAQSMNHFKLLIRSCKFDVVEMEIDASCLMLMALTSRNPMKDITRLVSN